MVDDGDESRPVLIMSVVSTVYLSSVYVVSGVLSNGTGERRQARRESGCGNAACFVGSPGIAMSEKREAAQNDSGRVHGCPHQWSPVVLSLALGS